MRLWSDIIDVIFPPRCAACDRDDSSGALCDKCGGELAAIAATPRCEKCSYPLGEGASCPQCEGRGIYPFERIVSIGPFRDPLKKLIHRMKYSGRWTLAETLTDILLSQERVREILSQTDWVVPVPLHWRRQISRCYNQAEIISRRLVGNALNRTGPKITRPLKRIRNTPTQTTIHANAQRFDNLRNAFSLRNGRQIVGARILLVDDVMTSSATLKSAANTLRNAHPASIHAVVLATADLKRRDFQVA